MSVMCAAVGRGSALLPVSSMSDRLVTWCVTLWPCGSLRLVDLLFAVLGLQLVLSSLKWIPRCSICWIVWLIRLLGMWFVWMVLGSWENLVANGSLILRLVVSVSLVVLFGLLVSWRRSYRKTIVKQLSMIAFLNF